MIPKSLHTITALARVAMREIQITGCGIDDALAIAVDVLGYAESDDVYGLIDKAAAVIAKGAK